MEERVRTGSKILDLALRGGYERGTITTIFGPAGSGKTILMILALINMARSKKKIIYIDTESSFSVERIMQIAKDYKRIMDYVLFLTPSDFEEQKKAFEELKKIIKYDVGLVIVDTISMQYRLEMGKKEDISETNRHLIQQITLLADIARVKNIPVLVTSQVYSTFDSRDSINMVGGDILRYRSKTLIELQTTIYGNRKAIIRKHRSIPENREVPFKIVEGGIIGIKEEKGFDFF